MMEIAEKGEGRVVLRKDERRLVSARRLIEECRVIRLAVMGLLFKESSLNDSKSSIVGIRLGWVVRSAGLLLGKRLRFIICLFVAMRIGEVTFGRLKMSWKRC